MSKESDNKIKEMAFKANRLKGVKTLPSNVIMITVEDIVEIVHAISPYTMSRLDDVEAIIKQEKSKLINSVINNIESIEI